MKLKKTFLVICLMIAVTLFNGGLLLQSQKNVSASESTTEVSFTVVDGRDKGSSEENYDKLFDGKKTSTNGTKYCITMSSNPYVTVKASKECMLTGYIFTTANDTASYSGRNPKSWIIRGSNDYNETTKQGTWIKVDEKTDDSTLKATNYTSYTFTVDEQITKKSYKYFKIEFLANQENSSALMQLAEIELQYSICTHNYTRTTVLAACEDGYHKDTCRTCGFVVITTIAGSGHNYSDWAEEEPATCIETGTKAHKTCSICGSYFDEDNNKIDDLTLPITSHNFAEIVEDEHKVSDMTCTAPAVYHKSCSVCGEESEETFNVGTPSHDFQEIVEVEHKVSDMTCTTSAVYHKSCSVCGEESEETFNHGTPSHDFQEIIEDEHKISSANCVSKDTYYKSCSVCGTQSTEKFTNGECLGHDVQENNKCSRCNRLIGKLVGDFGIIGGTENIDYKFEDNTLNILTSTPLRITQKDPNSATGNKIYIENGVNANLTLAGIYIDKSLSSYINDKTTMGECAFEITENSLGNVTITLEENTTNILKSGRGYAGLQKNGENGSLTIKGKGELVAMGGQGGAGIGSGSQKKLTSNIIILDGVITALGSRLSNGSYAMQGTQFEEAAGIGSGSNKVSVEGLNPNGNIIIVGGTITADGLSASAIGGTYKDIYSNIKIMGGSVHLSHFDYYATSCLTGGKILVHPTNKDGENVYLLTLANTNSEVVAIDGRIYDLKNHLALDNTDTNLYVYLTGETHVVQIGENVYTYTFESNTFTLSNTTTTTTTLKPLLISAKSSTEQAISGTDYTYEEHVLTILSSKEMVIEGTIKNITDRIVIAKNVSANLTLLGIDINLSSQENVCAFTIEEDSTADVNITLLSGVTNILRSGKFKAGIERKGHLGSLIINGNGNLVVMGGESAVGIDAGYTSTDKKDIVINGGSIKAKGTKTFGNSTKNVVPVNNSGEELVLLNIENVGRKDIYIDNVKVDFDYYADDTNYYAYLTKTNHTIKVDSTEVLYHFIETEFVKCSSSTTVMHDDSGHWLRCVDSECEVKYSFEAHTFDQRVKTAEFLKANATCEEDAYYYYSCTCGHKTLEQDFRDSDTNLGHCYTKPDGSINYKITEAQHGQQCIRCDYVHSYSWNLHTYDKECGDCTCTACGKVVSKPHDVVKGYYFYYTYDANQHWYPCRNTDCDYKDELANHTFEYKMSSESDKHVKRCKDCHYMQEGSLEECNYVITEKNERTHTYYCEKCHRYGSFDYHSYDDDCDTTCNVCGEVRTPTHYYDNACDTTCNECGATRVTTHVYDNDCDTTCNECGEVRTITHAYDNTTWCYDLLYHWHECSICEDKIDYSLHVYDNNEDHECNICSFVRSTPITQAKFLVTGYRYSGQVVWSPQVFTYSRAFEEVEDVYFSTDERLLDFEEDFDKYLIQSYSAMFEANKIYYGMIEFEINPNLYDISSLLANNIEIIVNGNSIKAKKIVYYSYEDSVFGIIGFELPKLQSENYKEVESDYNFKLTGYASNKKVGNISVELTNKVQGIDFNKNAPYGKNFFITTTNYSSDVYEKMIDASSKFEDGKKYYLAIRFETLKDYYLDESDNCYLEGYGWSSSSRFELFDAIILFRLHVLGATPLNNLDFSYSGYEVNKKIVDIKVNYDNATGIKPSDIYFDEDNWDYNYCIITDLDAYFSDDYEESDNAYVGHNDNGRFMPNKEYYLMVLVTPLNDNYSLKNFETVNITFNNQKADKIELYNSKHAFVYYKLPTLTGTSSTQNITEVDISISGYKKDSIIAQMGFEMDTTYIEKIVFAGDISKESEVIMGISLDENDAYTSVFSATSTRKFKDDERYILQMSLRAKDGYTFFGINSQNVKISGVEKFTYLEISAGGGMLYIEAELQFLKDWHEHEFVETISTFALKTSADCLNDAVYYKSCSCGELDTQTFVAENTKLGHNLESEWSADENGHYHACLRAGCNYKDSVTAHTNDRESATETDPIKCSICDYIVTPVVNHAHNLTLVSETQATCMHNGTKPYYTCDACEDKFEDASGLNKITDFENWVEVSGTHNFTALTSEVPATCIETGTKAHKDCEYCNKHFDANGEEILNITINKINHNLSDWVYEKEATCVSAGTKGYYHCSICNKNYSLGGSEITDLTLPVEPDNHDYKLVYEVPATCVSAGTKLHVCCENCDKLYDTNLQEITRESLVIAIDEDAHTFTEWIKEVPSTTKVNGTKAHKDCIHCHKHFDKNDVEVSDADLMLELKVAKNLSTGAIVGIVLGSTIVVFVGGFSIFWFVIKKKRFSELVSLAKNRFKK